MRRSTRILLIDDSEPIQRLMKKQLSNEGADVVIVLNGRDGVAAMLKGLRDGQHFDIVFMDLQMPKMDGYQTTRMLRAKGYKGPIVALTANLVGAARQHLLEAGCDECVEKPISKPALMGLIARYTQSRSQM